MKDSTQGMGFPVLATAGTALTALSMKDTIGGFLKKNWPWIVGLGLTGVSAWLVYDKFFRDKRNIDLKSDSSLPPSNLTELEAKEKANLLYQAMSSPGTDEDLIFDTLRHMNYNDFVKISKAFGKRPYDETFGTPGGFIFGVDLGLYEWLTAELSVNDLKQIQQIMPGVITSEPTVSEGRDVAAKNPGLQVFEAKNEEGVWVKKELYKTYSKGEKIGKVTTIIEDPWTHEKFAIFDRTWPFANLFAPVKDLVAI